MFKLGEAIGLLLIGAIIPLTPLFIQWLRKKFNKNDMDFLSSFEQDLKIQEMLTELRVYYGASRALVYLFHNGGHFLTGSPMKKMSCIYETAKRGVSYEGPNSRNLSISMLPDLISILSDEHPKLYNLEDLGDTFLKHYLDTRNVKQFAYIPLRRGVEIIGYVGINYCDEKDLPDDAEKDLTLMQQYAACLEVGLAPKISKLENE
jgi:hypothetical protein